MSTTFFRFKQFTVWHDRCAMKVGTDGVLLGAWCCQSGNREKVIGNKGTSEAVRILDVGTGSGLIALMIAQRFPEAQIDAIDIAPDAIEQATYNFSLSPWSDRLHAHLCPLQQVSPLRGDLEGSSYSLIVSNPPYFVSSLKNPDHGRELARHTDTLSYTDLLQHSARLLSDNGTLALILPASEEQNIIRLAATYGLYPTRLTRVFSKPTKSTPIRILIEFSPRTCSSSAASCSEASSKLPLISALCLESPTSPRSEEYAELTKDFYL